VETKPDKENRMTNAIVPNLTAVTPERSSNIASMGFADGILFVQFRRGALYAYDNVTLAEYGQLEAAKRISDVFGTLIKGVKPYRKVMGNTQQPETSMPASAPASSVAPAKPNTNVVPFQRGAVPAPAPALPKETDDLATAATQWAAKATAVEIKDVPTHEQAQKVLLDSTPSPSASSKRGSR
jgi:KTSC domain